jgi:hypothetical protein
MLGNGAKLIRAKLGGSQKHTGSILKSIATSNDTGLIFGNGAKLITPKLGGSQKHIGSMLKSMFKSNDMGSNFGG